MPGFNLLRPSAAGIAVLAVALAGCGGDGSSGGKEASQSRSVELAEVNGSGQSGSVTLTSEGEFTLAGSTQVVIELDNAPRGPQPAHIHLGTCEDLGDIEHTLSAVENGISEATVSESFALLFGAGDAAFAVDVHESEAGAEVACGTLSHGLPEP